MMRILIVTAACALAFGACATDGGSQDVETSASLPLDNTAPSSSDETPIPVEPNEGIGDGADPADLPVISPDLAEEVETALADLTERIGDGRLVEIVAAHELTWPDGSLGCPQPDMSYTQALIDGYRIELRVDGESFEYHGAIDEDPFLCMNVVEAADPFGGSPASEGVDSSGTTGRSAIAAEAQSDLAERLGVAPIDIAILSHEVVTWPDSSIGCPSKGMGYAQVLTSGTITILAGGGSEYRYHAATGAAPFLCLAPIDPVPAEGGDT